MSSANIDRLPVTSAGCEADAGVTTGSGLLLSSAAHPALSSSLAARRATREHASSGLTSVSIIRDNIVLSLIYGEKIWAGPPGPSVTMSPTISELSFGQRGTKLVLSAG